jgi:hypothetical protein
MFCTNFCRLIVQLRIYDKKFDFGTDFRVKPVRYKVGENHFIDIKHFNLFFHKNLNNNFILVNKTR